MVVLCRNIYFMKTRDTAEANHTNGIVRVREVVPDVWLVLP